MPRSAIWIGAMLIVATLSFGAGRLLDEDGDRNLVPVALDPIDQGPRLPLGPPAPVPQPPPLEVTLDPTGRPYDTLLNEGATVERRPLTAIHARSRRVLFMGGEETMYVEPGDRVPVTLAERPGRWYRVDAIWLSETWQGRRYDRIVGVVIVERDAQVVRWRQLDRLGYGTDAGLGAITTVERVGRRRGAETISRLYEEQLVQNGREWIAADVDGHAGVDTLIFANGFGDGGFPAVAGYDAFGRRVEIALWTIVAPWRLAFPDGRPPWQVTRRENALAACLAGQREIDGARCRVAS